MCSYEGGYAAVAAGRVAAAAVYSGVGAAFTRDEMVLGPGNMGRISLDWS